jgi:hypothetical protein
MKLTIFKTIARTFAALEDFFTDTYGEIIKQELTKGNEGAKAHLDFYRKLSNNKVAFWKGWQKWVDSWKG